MYTVPGTRSLNKMRNIFFLKPVLYIVQYNQDRMLSELGSNPSNLHTSEARGIMINRVGSTRYR